MTRNGVIVSVILGLMSPLRCAEPAQAQAGAPSAAAMPAPRFDKEDEKRALEYVREHERRLKALAAQRPDVIFIGDSGTQAWGVQGKDIWRERFVPLKAANIGSSGDRTQHVLWRIVNGEFATKPKAAVVLIGSNNTFYDSAEDITAGITAVVRAIRTESPDTRVLLMSILPRGNQLPNPRNDKSIAVNKAIAKLADGKTVWFIDIYAKYLEDGQLRKDLFIDDSHLTAKGFAIWADAIAPQLKELVGAK